MMMKKRITGVCAALTLTGVLSGCGQKQPAHKTVYELSSVHEVSGRQGICTDGKDYWVSGSTTLARYDHDWNLISENTDPFRGYQIEVNHIGDIDIYLTGKKTPSIVL